MCSLVLGLTLLEVMLVLAIAAMIIVMSVRYYQSATASQQANAVMEQIQAIVSAADNLAEATGGYSTITKSALAPLVPGGTFTTPWGTPITVGPSGGNGSNVLGITATGGPIPSGVCPLLYEKLSTNKYYSTTNGTSIAFSVNNLSTCTSGLVVYYILNPND